MALSAGEIEAVMKMRDDMSSVLNRLNFNLRDFEQTGTKAAGETDSAFSGLLTTMLGFAGGTVIMAGLGSAINAVAGAAIGMNAKLETTTLQFETLMGSASEAKTHVADLFEFAKKTPFETEPIIQASRMMRTFGGDTLDTKANLTLLGDAAAATGAPINELGFWVGRMYSNLKGGQPFGEAAMRLQELAVMSPKARQEMEAMQKAGKGADEIFKVFQTDLAKFTGAMEKQAATWEGVVSTFSDTVNILSAQALKPVFEVLRDAIGGLNDVLGSDGFAAIADSLASSLSGGLSAAIADVKELFGGLYEIGKDLAPLLEGLRDVAIDGAWGSFTASIAALKEVWEGLPEPLRKALLYTTGLQAIMDDMAGGKVDVVRIAFEQLARPIIQAAAAIQMLTDNVNNYLNYQTTFTDLLGITKTKIPPVRDLFADLAVQLGKNADQYMGLIPKIDEANTSTQRTKKEIEDAARAAKQYAKEIENLKNTIGGLDDIKKATQTLAALHDLQKQGIQLWQLTSDQQVKVAKTMEDAIEVYVAAGKKVPKEIALVATEMRAFSGTMSDAMQRVIGFRDALNDAFTIIKGLNPAQFKGMLDTNFFGSGQIRPDIVGLDPKALKDMFGKVGFFAAGEVRDGFIKRTFGDSKMFGAALSNTIMSAIQGGGNPISAAGSLIGGDLMKSVATTITSGAGLAIKGALGSVLNAVLPGVGSMIGSLLGPALSKLGSLFGFGSAGRDAVKDFAAQFGGFDALHKLLGEKLPADAERLWIALTQGVAKNDKSAAAKIIQQITDALNKQDAQASKLTATMEKYGITWEDLGQQAKQAKLDEMGQTLIEDFQTLVKGGIDVDTVIGKMGGSVNEFVQSAIRTGTEVPEAMKPLIQRMIELGLLTDKDGNKIESLEDSGISFAQSITKGFDRVVEKLDELINNFALNMPKSIGKTVDAALDGAKRVKDAWDFTVDPFGGGKDGREPGGGTTPGEGGGGGTSSSYSSVSPAASYFGKPGGAFAVQLTMPSGEVLVKEMVRAKRTNGW